MISRNSSAVRPRTASAARSAVSGAPPTNNNASTIRRSGGGADDSPSDDALAGSVADILFSCWDDGDKPRRSPDCLASVLKGVSHARYGRGIDTGTFGRPGPE